MGKLLFAGLFLAVAAIAHWATLQAIPGLIMDRAMARMENSGVPLHGFTLVPRVTPETQSVVRPSPDLAYSICRFDLGEAPQGLEVKVAGHSGMSSVSFFDAKTVNFAAIALSERQSTRLQLLPARNGRPSGSAAGPDTVFAPTQKGLILIRRLAPKPEDYASVDALSSGDACGPLTPATAIPSEPEE